MCVMSLPEGSLLNPEVIWIALITCSQLVCISLRALVYAHSV